MQPCSPPILSNPWNALENSAPEDKGFHNVVRVSGTSTMKPSNIHVCVEGLELHFVLRYNPDMNLKVGQP